MIWIWFAYCRFWIRLSQFHHVSPMVWFRLHQIGPHPYSRGQIEPGWVLFYPFHSFPFHNFQGKGSKAKAKLSCSRSSARSWIPPLFSTSDSVSNWVSDAFWLFLGLLFHAVPRGRRFGNSSWRFGCRQHSRKAWPSPARGREPGTPGSEHPVAGRGRWMMLDGHGGDGDIGGCLRSWNYGPSGNIYIYIRIYV